MTADQLTGQTHIVSAGFIVGGSVITSFNSDGEILFHGLSGGVGETFGLSYGNGKTKKIGD